jgi:hypothetical protein
MNKAFTFLSEAALHTPIDMLEFIVAEIETRGTPNLAISSCDSIWNFVKGSIYLDLS